jgi:hypothetical protein
MQFIEAEWQMAGMVRFPWEPHRGRKKGRWTMRQGKQLRPVHTCRQQSVALAAGGKTVSVVVGRFPVSRPCTCIKIQRCCAEGSSKWDKAKMALIAVKRHVSLDVHAQMLMQVHGKCCKHLDKSQSHGIAW